MNLANKLTVMRILLIPVFIVLLLKGYNYWAAAIFIFASLTDMLDGFIARKYGFITIFGKMMDPLADKLLVTSALVCLVQLGQIQAWMAIIILAREFLITGLRSVAAGNGKIIGASIWGKIKTSLQMLALSLLILKDWPFSYITDLPIGMTLFWLAIIVTIYSGFEYVYKSIELFKK